MTENFNQNFQNGRFCERDGYCISGCCTADTNCNPQDEKKKVTGPKVCTGLSEKDSCNRHDQCHVGLGCIKSDEWPFEGTCQTLRKDDLPCDMDQDCDINYYCWYKSVEDATATTPAKKCLQMYSLDKGQVFGYVKSDEQF